jgi:CDP-diacylglycerol--serine O-phosphatidyltransferase
MSEPVSPDNESSNESADVAESRSQGLPVDEHFEEEVSPTGAKVKRKGIYLLPNLFTTAALFSGFYAIIAGMGGNFANAAIAILAAQLLDGFDGRIARMTNTTSAFGVQYDSISDMVSFGLAPALVMFSWGLEPLGKFGWAAAFVYVACAAIRLARFNTQVETVDKKFFVGLASPPSAALLAFTTWVGKDVQPGLELSIGAAVLTVFLGLLMVSNLKYNSFKGLDLKGRVPFAALVAMVLVFAVITIDPPRMLLLMACIYAVSGPIAWLWARRPQKAADDTADED